MSSVRARVAQMFTEEYVSPRGTCTGPGVSCLCFNNSRCMAIAVGKLFSLWDLRMLTCSLLWVYGTVEGVLQGRQLKAVWQ